MDDWTWRYEGYDPGGEKLREALCTLGNGRFATRGASPETPAGPSHYPGTYVAGCFNRLTSDVAGHRVENEDMVNLPNWLPLRFRVRPADGPPAHWFTPDDGAPQDYVQELDLRRGLLVRRFRAPLPGGAALGVVQTRLVHMGDCHLAALHTEFTAEGFSGELDVESALDGTVTNAGVARYSALDGAHLTDVRTGADEPGTFWLDCRTSESGIRIALAARTCADTSPIRQSPSSGDRTATHRLTLPVTDGRAVTVDKTVALHTSRDPAIGDPLHAALGRAAAAPGWDEGLLEEHTTAWARLWRRAELHVPGEAGRVLRLHLFHVLQTLSPHTADLDVGVPARGLTGEAYRGHIFWDELFVLPYLNLHLPEVSRALLAYRHRRLGAACGIARERGRRGALYPWQSGSDGREETQVLHLNPRSGRWIPDNSHRQHHVNSAVAYNVWQYALATGDTDYLHTDGAETLLQIARFWADSAVWDTDLSRYRIRGVMGPDEYHDAYPDSDVPGLDDNSYTNVTAAWVLARALELTSGLPEPRHRELTEQLGLDSGELQRWDDVSRRLHVPWHQGVISQFAGYGDLAELDWEGYRARYGDIRRLDRILEAEGDTPNRYQASKQADLLMLGYLFPPAELAALFDRLGHRLDDGIWRRCIDHYLARTSNGSTLSALVHGWALTRTRRAGAWEFVQEALAGDVADIQGGTTAEAIHLGAMAGTLDLVQRGLTGLQPTPDALRLDPAPLPELSEARLTLRYRGHWGVTLRLRAGELRVGMPSSAVSDLPVTLGGRTFCVSPGGQQTFRTR